MRIPLINPIDQSLINSVDPKTVACSPAVGGVMYPLLQRSYRKQWRARSVREMRKLNNLRWVAAMLGS